MHMGGSLWLSSVTLKCRLDVHIFLKLSTCGVGGLLSATPARHPLLVGQDLDSTLSGTREALTLSRVVQSRVESWPSRIVDCYRLRSWPSLSKLVVSQRAEARRYISLAKLMKIRYL